MTAKNKPSAAILVPSLERTIHDPLRSSGYASWRALTRFACLGRARCIPGAISTGRVSGISNSAAWTLAAGLTKRESARIARGQRLEQAMPFGSVITEPEPGAAARFIRGRLVCARNIGAELARRGIRGTGSALAKSYLRWGRPSGPQPGAVAVFSRGRRGGHVAIVDSVRPDGTVIYLNP